MWCIFACTCLLIPLFVDSPVYSQKIKELSPDELAWQKLMPEIEVFWHEYQASPHKLAEEVWPFISELKDFIKRYPKSQKIPEAYYILGEAYAVASYWPEAVAHWKIVVRYYPDSKWTSAALNSLVARLEKQGNQEKLKKFYREILRQFPDSIAAKTTRVLLARQALQEGKVGLVKRVIKSIEKSSGSALVEVPELLDLKAAIANREGRPKEAIRLWVRYINLKKSPVARAGALFNIAETYRKAGDWLKARKYYALIRRDFSSQPEALFARFRMLQMEEIQKRRLAQYVKGKVRPLNLYESERVFREIVKKFPKYPLTQEVRKELIATKVKKKDYMEALILADDFIQTSPQGPYSQEVIKLAETAARELLKQKLDIEKLEKVTGTGRAYLGRKPRNRIQKYIQDSTQKLWVRLIKTLTSRGRALDAINSYWIYIRQFRNDPASLKEAFGPGLKALEAADRWFYSENKYADLIDYHFQHEKEIKSLGSAAHYYMLARAFSKVGLPRMALRAFFTAWRSEPTKTQKCEILVDWTGQCLEAYQSNMAQDTIGLLDLCCPDYALQPVVLYYKSALAGRQGDWTAAFNMARDSISGKPDDRNVFQALYAGIKLGEWDQVEKIYKENSSLLSKEKRINILKKWGDEAIRFFEYRKALVPYGFLTGLDAQDPSAKFRMAVAKSGALGFEKAIPSWEELSKKDKGIWGKAAKSEISFYKFMTGPAGQL